MLSTVGVRKHYHQDYLVHSLRTDFAGKNGVGKSIIADLLQLIFVQDRSLITFGTDGLKRKLRKIETIPYKHHQAYAYLTIETAPEQYICIGVSIPTDPRTPLIPFIITREIYNSRASLSNISYSKEKILVNKDFLLKESTVLPIKELVIHIRNNNNLYLHYFKNKSEIREYHAFLKRHTLLPVNLGIDSNLAAFAKVIQSFSRAKDFNPADSKKLKDFLFDEVSEEYVQDFTQHKAELADQLNNYKELSKTSDDISQKRKSLGELKQLENIKIETELLWYQVQLILLQKAFQEQEEKVKKTIANIEHQEHNLELLTTQVDRLEMDLIPLADRLANDSYNKHIALAKCSDLLKDYNRLLEDEQLLQQITIPDLTNFKTDIEVTNSELTIDALCERVRAVLPLLTEFSSLELIEAKVLEQEEKIKKLSNETEHDIEQASTLLEVVQNNKANTLFSKVLDQGSPLTAEQESVLFYLINASWGKPDNISIDAKYVTDLSILDPSSITPETSEPNSFWFSVGCLHYLIKLKKEPQLLNKIETIEAARSTLKDQLVAELQLLEDRMIELKKIRAGREFDQTKLGFLINPNLVTQQQFDEIKKDIKRTESIHLRINQIRIEKNNLENEFQVRLGIYEYQLTDLNQLLKNWENIKEQRQKRLKQLNDYLKTGSLKMLQVSSDIPRLKTELINMQEGSNDKLEALSLKRTEFESFCRESNIGQFKLEEMELLGLVNPKESEKQFKDALENYTTTYFHLAFDYTRDNMPQYNAEIDEQVKSKSFKFPVLEMNLLRGIGLLENIETYLSELNTKRLQCRRTIYGQIKSLFSKTLNTYSVYKNSVRDLNSFFNKRKISQNFIFKIEFQEEISSGGHLMIDWLNKLRNESDQVFEAHELQLGKSVDEFIESFYKEISKEAKLRSIRELLDPKSYFNVTTRLIDERGKEVSGSTGEAYTSIVLLGIGRISIISEKNEGIKFVILEETASVDEENFELVMEIAAEFKYQILTMTPKPYGIGSSSEWYLHQLIKGQEDTEINYPTPASYIRSITGNKSLLI